MKIILTDDDILKLIYTCLVDGGAVELKLSDVVPTWYDSHYDKAKEALKKNPQFKDTICFEDVLVQIIRQGDHIAFKDHNEDKVIKLTLDLARTNLSPDGSLREGAVYDVVKILNEDSDADAWTGYNVMQWMLFGEVVYG